MNQFCSSLLQNYRGSTIACFWISVKAPVERAWYIEQAIQNGWSRNVLVMQIESGLYRRQGKALTNFQATSIIAEYALRDVLKPLGISEFRHRETLPEQLKGTPPTIEEIEAELGSSEKAEA
jgi:hypothetical protein